MKKRKWVILALILISVSVGLIGQTPTEENLAITHGPWLVDPAENGITVLWRTNKKCVSRVEYGTGESPQTFPTWGSLVHTARRSEHGLIDAYTKLHRIRLEGLKPGLAYRYRVVSKEFLQFKPYEVIYGQTVVSDIFGFKTLDRSKKRFSFGAVTDVHGRSEDLDILLQQVNFDPIDLMFLTGDITSWLESEDQIFDGFLDVCVDRFSREIPLVYIRGNHETRGLFARNLMDYFPHSTNRFYYGFAHGPVYFIVLDTGEDKADSHPVYAGLADFDSYREKQKAWLAEEVKKPEFKDALFRVVVFHIPVFMDSERHAIQDLTAKWGPILNEPGVDLVLNGHMHRFIKKPAEAEKNNFHNIVLGLNLALTANVTEEGMDIKVVNNKGRALYEVILKPKKPPIKERD